MWEKVDQLWHQSPAFKLLGPIALIGAFLVMANMASQPAGQDLEARPHAKSASPMGRAYDNLGEGLEDGSSLFKDGVKTGSAMLRETWRGVVGGSKKKGVPEPEPNSEVPASTSSPGTAPAAPK